VIKEKWGKGDTVPDTQIFKLDFTKSARYSKRKIHIKRKGSSSAWQGDASNTAGSTAALTAASTINLGHLSLTSTVSGNLAGIEEGGSEETWGEGNTVPDSQIFTLDFTKSSRYSKRKIKLTRKGTSSAWQDDVSTSTDSTPSFTAASTMNIFDKAESEKMPRADEDDGAAQSEEVATPRDPHFDTSPADELLEVENGDEPQMKRTPTNAWSSPPQKAASAINSINLSSKHAVTVKKLQAENAPNFTSSAQDSSSAALPERERVGEDFDANNGDEPPIKRTRSTHLTDTRTSLIEEGLAFHRESRQGHLVGTVHSDGTVETKRRWFCCGRRALGAAEQRAIAAVIPKQEEGIDKALTDTIRDRVRRSQRNARFHR
jgi:hypothetical protein